MPKQNANRQKPKGPASGPPPSKTAPGGAAWPDAPQNDFLALLQDRLPALFYRGRLKDGALRLDHVGGRIELTGCSAEALCGIDNPFTPLIHPDDRDVYHRGLAQAAAAGGCGRMR